MTELTECLQGWSPPPVRHADRIRGWPVDAFAGLLDQPPLPDEPAGTELPAMWHVFSFLDHPSQGELGVDGHPADGTFLPPLPHRRRMFAGGRWTSHLPLRVDDEVVRTSTVTSVEVKSGRSGEMAFVTVRSEYVRAAELAAVEEQDIVYRIQPPAPLGQRASAAAAPPEPPDGPAPQHELSFVPDPPMLFRFSALTYNAHRIHYDQPYATGVEAYPGLVVHGPLLALFGLELPRRQGRRVVEFRYQLRRPAFVGNTVVARSWAPDKDGWCELAVGEQGQAPSLTATARLEEIPG